MLSLRITTCKRRGGLARSLCFGSFLQHYLTNRRGFLHQSLSSPLINWQELSSADLARDEEIGQPQHFPTNISIQPYKRQCQLSTIID